MCDFFLWGFLKDSVYASNPKSLPELEKAIIDKVATIDEAMLDRVCTSFVRRIKTCSDSEGGHFENIYV